MPKASHKPACVSSILLPSYEYQKKGVPKFAICKCMIQKEMFLAEQEWVATGNGIEKEKREQAPALPNAIIYEVKYSRNYGIVKSDLRFPKLTGLERVRGESGEPRQC
jgi:hypothetical protein